MTRVLVTGAYGCIGSWVTRDLVGRGIDVIAYDLGDDPRRMALIMDEAELARVAHVRGDITDLEALEAVIDAEWITNIIHLAALQVPFCRADPPLGRTRQRRRHGERARSGGAPAESDRAGGVRIVDRRLRRD